MVLNYWHCLTESALWLTAEALMKDYVNCKASPERIKNMLIKTMVITDVRIQVAEINALK